MSGESQAWAAEEPIYAESWSPDCYATHPHHHLHLTAFSRASTYIWYTSPHHPHLIASSCVLSSRSLTVFSWRNHSLLHSISLHTMLWRQAWVLPLYPHFSTIPHSLHASIHPFLIISKYLFLSHAVQIRTEVSYNPFPTTDSTSVLQLSSLNHAAIHTALLKILSQTLSLSYPSLLDLS